MGRTPFKEESEKQTESITIGLDKSHTEALQNYAKQAGLSVSSAIKNILEPCGCFNHEVSDEEFEELKTSANTFLIRTSNWIPSHEIKTFRSRITKNELKSLYYEAMKLHNTAHNIFIRDVVEKFLDPTKNNDYLLKKLWQSATLETKKELLDEYLKSIE